METASPPRTSVTWLPCADGLRATAAVLVFLHHAGFLTAATFHSRAGGLLDQFDIGPAIFFALSGLLLTRPYVGAILDGTALPDWRSFYRRRVLRIVPAYWVALTLTYLWLRPESATEAEGIDYPLHYLFLQIYPADTFPKGISPAWTLAVEMAFYASLPLLAMGAARLVRPLAGASRRALGLLGALAAVTVLSLIWRSLVYGWELPLQAALWLPGTMSEFAIGIAASVLALWAVRRPVARPVADALGRHDLLWWTFAALLLVFSASQLGLARGLDHASWNRELFGQITRMGAIGFFLLPVAFGPQDRGVVRGFLRSWPVASMGIIAYGFFLWHVPLIEVALRITDQPMFLDWSQGIGLLSGAVVEPVAIAFGLAVVAGTLSWFLVEKPTIHSALYRGSIMGRGRPSPAVDTPVDRVAP